jgi:alpha-galactosidase
MKTKRTLFFALMGATLLLGLTGKAKALDNGLALTPPMGWNSYNKFGGNVTQAQVLAVAKAFVTSGLKEAGYQFIVIDYCWAEASRDGGGSMVPRKARFPSGMKSISDSVHSLGLKFGMYASPNTTTCCGSEAGSYQHETKDAQNFADWGVDYLKYDWCGVQSGEDKLSITPAQIIARYVTMREAIKVTKRPIVYALCEKGQKSKIQPATWSDTVGNMWRIHGDIAATWDRIMAQVDVDVDLGAQSGPVKGWNDPDMLEVGNGSLTETENRSHFSLWCILAAPLMMGNDPSNMSASVKAILTNKEAIAINQDSLGKQGVRIRKSGNQEVWVKKLKNGDRAVLLLNRDASGNANLTVNWTDAEIGWTAATKVKVRSIWDAKDQENVTAGYTASVPGHGAVLLRLSDGSSTAISAGRWDATAARTLRGKHTAQGLNFEVPTGMGGKLKLVDMGGAAVPGLALREGWNLVPAAKLHRGVYFLRVDGPQGPRTFTLVHAP